MVSHYYENDVLLYIITQNLYQIKFSLYKVDIESKLKLMKNNNTPEFKEVQVKLW